MGVCQSDGRGRGGDSPAASQSGDSAKGLNSEIVENLWVGEARADMDSPDLAMWHVLNVQ